MVGQSVSLLLFGLFSPDRSSSRSVSLDSEHVGMGELHPELWSELSPDRSSFSSSLFDSRSSLLSLPYSH